VLILRNDYSTRLFNGDLGIVLHDSQGEPRAWFPGEKDNLRSFSLAQLPEHETAFAMTVHKAQGSEFGTALIVLPEADSPILTRELLYTAITRAQNHVQLWWTETALATALRRRVIRWSGLRARLAQSTPMPHS
jgi:exodeoxyribonuclease V alpha subunit